MKPSELKAAVHKICSDVIRAKPAEQADVLRREIKKLPADVRDTALSLIELQSFTAKKSWWPAAFFFTGLLLILVAIVLICEKQNPSQYQANAFWVILSLGAAFLGAFIPGTLNIKAHYGQIICSAGGAVGMFFLIYTHKPAPAEITPSPVEQTTNSFSASAGK